MKAADVIYLRRELLESTRRFMAELSDTAPPSHIMTMSDVAEILQDCQAFFVTGDMCTVAEHASEDLPVRSLGISAIPAKRGIILFEQPAGRLHAAGEFSDIYGVMWNVIKLDKHGMTNTGGFDYHVNDYEGNSLTGTVVDLIPLAELSPEAGSSVAGQLHFPGEGYRMLWHIGGDVGAADSELISVAKKVLASWALMQQPITTVSKQAPDRAERRRCERARMPSDFTVVTLRRLSESPSKNNSAGVTEWSHRWLVSGHWTRQPCGRRRSMRRLTWINPYVKGPFDKPLIVKDKVNAWVR